MGTTGSFPGGEADHSRPTSAEVKECVELYLHYPNMPSWRGAQFTKKERRDNFTFYIIFMTVNVSIVSFKLLISLFELLVSLRSVIPT